MPRTFLRAAFALGLFSIGAAAPGCDAHELGPSNATPAQEHAYEDLSADTERTWTWVQDERLGTPAHLSAERRGAPVLVQGVSPSSATRSFLKTYRALYKMIDPDAELTETKTIVDHLSMTHVRFQQTSRGVPVVGAEVFAHFDPDGRIASIDASYVPGLGSVDVVPRIDPHAALGVLVHGVHGPGSVTGSVGRLVIYAPPARPARLAYELTVRAAFGPRPAVWVDTVDAITGETLHRVNALRFVAGAGTGVLGEPLQLEVSQGPNGFEMLDRTHPVTVRTQTADNVESTQGGRLVQSSSLSSWDTGGTAPGHAVSAHAFATQVASYYATRLGWSGQDGKGAPIVTTVHYGVDYDNAFWDTTTGGGVFFGDGNTGFRPAAVDSDVVCHELTHGVTAFASGLGFEGEPGALNESISDIFAAFFKHSIGTSDQLVWIFGPHWDRTKNLTRDMREPANGGSPDHMSKFIDPASDPDDGGLHHNAGIPNNAAFLMTMGGRNPTSGTEVKFGIGYDKSEKLWWRTLTTYTRETTSYAQLAASMQQAATDNGLTQNDKNIIDCAWKAVGVVAGACAEITAPPPPEEPTTTTKSKSVSGGDDDDDDSSKTKTKKKKAALETAPVATSGCSAGARGPQDLGAAALFAAAAAIVARRRRSKSVT